MWRPWVNAVICRNWFFVYFFVSTDPTFSSYFNFFNLYPRINVPIPLKVTGQFLDFTCPHLSAGVLLFIWLWGLSIFWAEDSWWLHMDTFGVRREPWPLMRHAEIYAIGKEKSWKHRDSPLMAGTLPHYLPLLSFLHSFPTPSCHFFLSSFLSLSVSNHLRTNFVGMLYISLFDSHRFWVN